MNHQATETQRSRLPRPLPLCLGVLAVQFVLTVTALVHARDEAPTLISTTGGESGAARQPVADLQQAATAGDPQACLQLGLRYETGDGVKQDYPRARALYAQAAAGGVAVAIYRLGKFAQDGLGTDADLVRAYQLYRLAALAGVPLAQYNLGAMLVSARGVDRDYVEGLAWLIVATRNQAGGDGEKRVRARLAGQPQAIAAAEKRAAELDKEIAARRGTKPPWPPPETDTLVPTAAAPRPTPEKPAIEPPQVEPPKFEPPPLQPPALPATSSGSP